jgi:hypothetical protein
MIGEVGATYPLAGTTGKILRVGGKEVLKHTPKLVKALEKYRLLDKGWVPSAAAEGAVIGGAVGDPEKRGEAGGLGALLNVGGSALLKTLARTAGPGVIQRSVESDNLRTAGELVDVPVDIPAGQAMRKAEPDIPTRIMGGTILRKLMPYFAGTMSQLESQMLRLHQAAREIAVRRPDYARRLPDPKTSRIEDIESAVETVSLATQKDYLDTVFSYNFRVPRKPGPDPNVPTMVSAVGDEMDALINAPSRLDPRMKLDETTRRKIAEKADGFIERYSEGQDQITGMNMMEAKNAFDDWVERARLTPNERIAARNAGKWFDNHIEAELTQGNVLSNIDDLNRYKLARASHNDLRTVLEAVKKAEAQSGAFTPQQLVASARGAPEQTELGKVWRQSTSTPTNSPAAEGRNLGTTLGLIGPAALGAAAGFATKDPLIGTLVAATPHALANTMMTMTGQKVLTGATKKQRQLAELMRKHPEFMEQLRSAAGATGTVFGLEQEERP